MSDKHPHISIGKAEHFFAMMQSLPSGQENEMVGGNVMQYQGVCIAVKDVNLTKVFYLEKLLNS